MFISNHQWQSKKAKGFNGPPTARSEPGRDHPCLLAIVATARLAILFEGRWSRPVNCTRIHERYPSITDMPYVQPLLNSPSKALDNHCPMLLHTRGEKQLTLNCSFINWSWVGFEPSPWPFQWHSHWPLHHECSMTFLSFKSIQEFSKRAAKFF